MNVSPWEYFVHYIFPAAIFILGNIGNGLGFIVLSRKKMRKLSSARAYKYLLASDTFYLLQLPILNIVLSYPKIDPVSKSVLFCKIFLYLDFALVALSPMLLIYISMERLISIKFPTQRFILKKQKYIILFSFLVTVFNLLYYIEAALYYNIEIKHINSTFENETIINIEETKSCTIKDSNQVQIISYMYVAEDCIFPYVIMLICTGLMCYTIFSSRITANNHGRIKKDLKFTITSISLNLVFILLTLPISLANFSAGFMSDIIFVFTDYLFFSSYGVNFYLFLMFNSAIRKEFFSMFYSDDRNVSQASKSKTSNNSHIKN